MRELEVFDPARTLSQPLFAEDLGDPRDVLEPALASEARRTGALRKRKNRAPANRLIAGCCAVANWVVAARSIPL